MKVHDLKGGGGLRLHVREWGKRDAPPILFIHGWSACHLCWRRQYQSELVDEFRVIAFDLRGHGMSDAPVAAEHYTQAQLWADDVAAIIEQLELESVILVGWSYGGYVVCDYLRAYGDRAIAGVNLAGAGVTLNPSAIGTLIGQVFAEAVAGASGDDLPTAIEALRNLVHTFPATPLAPEDHETALCSAMAVPASVLGALATREINSDDVLAALSKPVLMSQGEKDRVCLPAMGEHVLATCPTATASWYADVGHAPFLEDPDRFNRELLAFAHDCRTTQHRPPHTRAAVSPEQ